MPRSSHRFHVRALGAALALGSVLAGCSDLYYDRRETVSFGAGDAAATDAALQTIDPWPRGSENRDFSTNGPRMAGAIERYRTGRVIQPLGTSTSSVGYGAAPAVGQGGAPVTTSTGGSAPNN
jgi:hypothetical protein